MNQIIHEPKAELEAFSLEVKTSGECSLLIAATSRDVGDGLRLSNDASALLQRDDRWVAVFPAAGTLSYEVPGDLPDLLPLIRKVQSPRINLPQPLKKRLHCGNLAMAARAMRRVSCKSGLRHPCLRDGNADFLPDFTTFLPHAAAG